MSPQAYEYYDYYEYCVGGIYSHRPILEGCDTQRLGRRPGGGLDFFPGAWYIRRAPFRGFVFLYMSKFVL